MAESQTEPSARVSFREVLPAAVSSGIGAGIFYGVMGGVFQADSLKGLPYSWAAQVGLALAAGVVVFFVQYRDLRRKARDRALTARIDEELKQSAGGGGGDSVAAVSTSAVAAKVTGDESAAKKVEEYVEQRKQRLLVDKKTLSAELAYLVDNWQPLPRDVKRGVNRFCVTYLVAYNRGLLKDPPVVSGFQLAKWLALSERWPQLGRALAMAPDEMRELERYASDDRFPGIVAALAPLDAADPALRRFIADEPRLSQVLPRLVQYGMAQPAAESAVTVKQVAPLPETAAASRPS